MRELWAEMEIHRGGAVKRFHTWPTIGVQTVAEHSWGVARVLMWLYEDCSLKLLKVAITHDVTEFVTGDIPFCVKRMKPEIKKLLGEIEDHEEHLLALDNDLDLEDKRRLKVADYVECMFYCISQKELGNKMMDKVMSNLLSALYDLCVDDEKNHIYELSLYYRNMFKEEDSHG